MWTEDRDFCYISLVIDSKVAKAQVSTYYFVCRIAKFTYGVERTCFRKLQVRFLCNKCHNIFKRQTLYESICSKFLHLLWWFNLGDSVITENASVFVYFWPLYIGQLCFDPCFAYVAHLVFLRDVWIGTAYSKQARYQLNHTSLKLSHPSPCFATHLPSYPPISLLSHSSPYLATWRKC